MDPACSAGLFFDGGKAGQRGLTDFPYDTDARTPGGWAQAVQVSAFPDRYDQHWAAANELYDRLAGTTTEDEGDDWMANPELEKMIRELHGALFNKVTSESRYRRLGEGPRWQLHEMVRHNNGFAHEEFVEREAREGDPDAIALVYEVANADPGKYPDRQQDAAAARRFLASLTAAAPVATPPPVPGAAAPPIAHSAPAAPVQEALIPVSGSLSESMSQTVATMAKQLDDAVARAAAQVQQALTGQ